MEISAVIALIISVVSLVISGISFFAINRIRNANLELNIYNTIRSSRISLIEAIKELSRYEKDNHRIQRNAQLLYESAIEDYVTTYNYACAQYLDKKVDRKRFKKNFKTEISNLFTNEDIKRIVSLNDRTAITRYDALLEVYQEWFKTE